MAELPQKWHKRARGQERRKASSLKTIPLGNGSYFPDTSDLEYIGRTAHSTTEGLSPIKPPRAVIRDFHLFSGVCGGSPFTSHPYMRLHGGTGRSEPAVPPGAPPTTPAGRGLPKVPNPLNFNQEILLIPPAVGILAQGTWPTIYFGDDAPFPRVRIILDSKDPQNEKDLSMSFMKSAPGKSAISGVPTGDVRLDPAHLRYNAEYKVSRAFDSTLGLGGLLWNFEPGNDPANWQGLTRDQVIELMYRSLEEVMEDRVSRDQLRDAISKGPLAKKVENTKDTLPALPQPTTKGNFPNQYGRHPLADAHMKSEDSHYSWEDHTRPGQAIRPRANNDPKLLKFLAQRLLAYMKGIMEKEDDVDDLHDISSEGDNAPQGPRISPRGSPNRAAKEVTKEASKEGDPIEVDPPLADPELGPDPMDTTEDGGGRTARVGEYKCVWFCVIVLILSMFLCLFLYSFKIIE